MDIHQCPRCELRFVNTSELRHHFEFDHAADPRVFERYRYRTSDTGPADRRTILLVGNQTLERDAVLDEVATRAADGAQVLVVVPATHHRHDEGDGADMGSALARHRLQGALERLRAMGIVADGEVGDADPYAATCRALAGHDIDEILLSTLPPSSSRWLSVDLPGRLRRHTTRRVTVLTPAAAEREAG
jgi:hypothetical protein